MPRLPPMGELARKFSGFPERMVSTGDLDMTSGTDALRSLPRPGRSEVLLLFEFSACQAR